MSVDLLKPPTEKLCCIFWTISLNKNFSNLYVSVPDIHLKQLKHLEWNFLIYKKSYTKALGWWEERGWDSTLLIQLQNLNFIMTFQTNWPFNKTWARSLSVNNTFTYTTEYKSLKYGFSFIRMFSHKLSFLLSWTLALWRKIILVNVLSNYH